jgi:hypothetical protein
LFFVIGAKLPTPTKNESKDEYIKRFMGSEEATKSYPDSKQRLAVAYSMWREHSKSKKEEMFSDQKIESKSSKDDNLVVGGYIATTHIDSGFDSKKLGGFVRDKIDRKTLDKWAAELNEGIPRANKVSIRHDRSDPVVAGVAIKGTAKVVDLVDGEAALYVESIIDSTHQGFDTTKNRLDIGTIDSFSIEFITDDYDVIEKEGYIERHLLPGTELLGYTLASRPMNEYAVRTKETDSTAEVTTVTTPEVTVIDKKAEVIEMPETIEVKENIEISKEDHAEFVSLKEKQHIAVMEKEKADLFDKLKAELKESLKDVKVEEKAMYSGNDKVESKEFQEYKEAIETKTELRADGSVASKISVDEMFRRAGKYADKIGLTVGGKELKTSMAESREFKHFSTNGTMLEYKGLGTTTNQGATSYLSTAELSDVFDPVIYTALNQATVTWNLLRKEDFSSKGNNYVQFVVKTAANTTATAYLGNTVATGNVTRLKVQTKFKKYQVGVEIDGDMIAAAKGGPIGDVFAQEVKDSTVDLLSVMNQALFAEVGAETAAGVIGFEYIADSAGNTTLYGITRSSATLGASTFLSPAAAADTYINGSSADLSLANLRAAKRQALKEGANIGGLVFITNHIQGDKFRGIFDAAQRTTPTSSRFGFEGRPEFDGIPMFEDKDCNTDDVWLIDLETHKIAMWVPPTLEMLGKDSDSQKGFIKCYWAVFNTYPRRLVQIYGNATS